MSQRFLILCCADILNSLTSLFTIVTSLLDGELCWMIADSPYMAVEHLAQLDGLTVVLVTREAAPALVTSRCGMKVDSVTCFDYHVIVNNDQHQIYITYK